MDPRHKLYKTLDNLSVDPDPDTGMSAQNDADAAQVAANSGITIEGIKKKLEQVLQASHVEIEDMSGMYRNLLVYSRNIVFGHPHLVLVLLRVKRQHGLFTWRVRIYS